MWAARRVEAIKREAVRLCPEEARANVRFRAIEPRRHHARLVIEYLDGADVRALCARFPECSFYVRSSNLVVYVPLTRPPILTFGRAAAVAWLAAAACLAAGGTLW